MKQETLEEAAERIYPINFSIDYDKNKEERDIWLEGAKWQAEQDKNMYSEEEVLEILNQFDYSFDPFRDTILQWFEKYKKK